jgi:hypothetical protein
MRDTESSLPRLFSRDFIHLGELHLNLRATKTFEFRADDIGFMPGPEFSGHDLNLKLIEGMLYDLRLLESRQLLRDPEQKNAGHNAAVG